MIPILPIVNFNIETLMFLFSFSLALIFVNKSKLKNVTLKKKKIYS